MKSKVKEILSWIIPIAVALILGIVIKNYIIINAVVPTGSMENTIMTGDHIIGSRLAYLNKTPERGDIVVFDAPDEEGKKFVKRVIGLPGEKVVINQGRIYINDSQTPIEEPYLKEEWVRNTGPYEFYIPNDCYLMLGDNRNTSDDARLWENPYVQEDKIYGEVKFIYYPFSRFGGI